MAQSKTHTFNFFVDSNIFKHQIKNTLKHCNLSALLFVPADIYLFIFAFACI